MVAVVSTTDLQFILIVFIQARMEQSADTLNNRKYVIRALVARNLQELVNGGRARKSERYFFLRLSFVDCTR